ncbi:hypothetical protein [Nitrosomonas mobilis]|uniref:Uncharacterized protein n=1 Tax=Nitrosomonas mobilis TaxID=51642 RepID=A0A1G5SEP6_9PROT|nr:hypothetical protein [Nitrosomonas mobilis]SCZ85021.1 conserved hypothetical protein [Nitrosomonas mobilis]HNO76222.1 hypothetical protein [Nitrosomonas mobilis]
MQKKLWIYDGPSQYVNLKLPSISSALSGGYILFFFLHDGSVWLYSSCHPGKCVSGWSQTARRYGLQGIGNVMISRPFLFYTLVRKRITENIVEYKQENSSAYNIERKILIPKAEEVFMMAEPLPDNHG